jgi:uncharacterized membrane protein
MGVLAFFMFYAIPMYYLEVAKELDSEHQEYFNKNKTEMFLWWLMGFLCACLTTVGAIICA